MGVVWAEAKPKLMAHARPRVVFRKERLIMGSPSAGAWFLQKDVLAIKMPRRQVPLGEVQAKLCSTLVCIQKGFTPKWC